MRRPTAMLETIFLCLILLAGCDAPLLSNATASPTQQPSPLQTATANGKTAEPITAVPTPEPTPEPTKPGVLPPDVYDYFERVGFGTQGDAPAIAKWTEPIRVQVHGAPNSGDGQALSAIIGKLKGIKGMPEINFVTEGGNIVIGYVSEGRGKTIDAGYNGTDDAQVFVKMEGSALISVHIILTDAVKEQPRRDASLAFFLFNGLGLNADPQSELADSILNRGGTAAVPSGMDWLMLRLLYGAQVSPGMQPGEAMPVITAFDPGTGAADASSANNPNISREDMLAYFNEVGFYWPAKIRDGVISKWTAPIKLQITGTPSEQQKPLLDTYIAAINEIEGFPGFEVVESGGAMEITYQTTPVLKKSYPKMTAAESCYISVSRGEKNGIIAKCTIGVATDFVDEAVAQNQFLRLLMKSLGFTFTSSEYPDSIFNYSSTVQQWSSLDWKMVGLLYRGDIKAGRRGLW